MTEIIGNIWDYAGKNTIVCILTNGTVTKNGLNPMGGGIAAEALERNPGLDYICGDAIKNDNLCLGIDKKSKSYLFRFETKKQVWLPSDITTISDSLDRLIRLALHFSDRTILLPRPGCGYGGLDWDTDVKPLLEKKLKNINNIIVFSK